MTHRGASISNLGSVFAVVLLQAGFPALATAQPDYSMSNAKWKSSEQMVQSFTRSLRQQGRLTTPHNAIDLQGSQLFARNFWLEGATAMTVLKRLQSEHPLLSRLQVAPDEFVLSGQDENTHCMVSLKGVELLKQTVMISCATLSQRHAEAIFPHPALSVRWSWHEHLPAQSVYQQIIEIREKERTRQP
ncbi:hypothetical protein L1889_05395 [Paenalcaligenes niemegkensis]|uniref:hypothetical protein n=1 Tax=Paenalcaligenes niemegkensis TaxID=2895469 RepID=UPI001EE82CB5|nr:hypothetical protein [Paenalcaligenes niemegkensis]MCQ9616204.1 hypothetical protein [Paenalcaligenes niemegkensis]